MHSKHLSAVGAAALLFTACGGRSLLGGIDDDAVTDDGGVPAAAHDGGLRDSGARFDATTQESGAGEGGAPADAGPGTDTGSAGPWTLMLSGDDLNVPALVIGNAIEVGDVTGDGRDDIVVAADRYDDAGLLSGALAVFVQTPEGLIAKPIWYDSSSEGLVLGDVTGDGRNDVILASISGNQSAGGLAVLAQSAGGVLSPPFFAAVDGEGGAIVLDDRIGIGRFGGAQLSVVQGANPRGLALWQQSQGGLSFGGSFASDDYDLLEVGDVTGDGLDDVVVTLVDNGVSVVPQTSAGGFGAFRRFPVDTSEPFIEGLAVGDVTGDGLADVVVAYGGNAPRSRITVLPQANGGLAAPIPYECLDNPEDGRIADMNGDGLLDFVVDHGGFSSAGVFLQLSNGRFAPEQTFAWRGGGAGRGHGIAVGDLNGDGKPDIAGVGQNGISLLLSE